MMPGSFIAFIYFSLSKTQAELTGYGQIKNIVDMIPYFRDKFPRNEKLNSMMVFQKMSFLSMGLNNPTVW